MLNILVTIIYLFGDSAWWPWHLSSTKNVDMKMINWLGSIPSIIDDWKQTEKASQILDGAGGGGLCHHVFPNPTWNFQFILVINPLSTKIHIYILQTGLHTFPQRISWENMMKDLSIFFVVFILLIYYSHNLFSWNWCMDIVSIREHCFDVGHSLLMHMCIRYHFLADLNITRRVWTESEKHIQNTY